MINNDKSISEAHTEKKKNADIFTDFILALHDD